MANITNEKLGLSFTLPDKPTVYQILMFDSKLNESVKLPVYLKLWETAKTVISDWKCDAMPDFKTPLETIEGEDDDMNKIARVIEFVGAHTIAWRNELDLISKN